MPGRVPVRGGPPPSAAGCAGMAAPVLCPAAAAAARVPGSAAALGCKAGLNPGLRSLSVCKAALTQDLKRFASLFSIVSFEGVVFVSILH